MSGGAWQGRREGRGYREMRVGQSIRGANVREKGEGGAGVAERGPHTRYPRHRKVKNHAT